MCEDEKLAGFLNGLIIKNRGPKGDYPAETVLNNNMVLRKLKIALNLQADDFLEILKLNEFALSKHELSALFRRPDHKNYRKCHDQLLRNVLDGETPKQTIKQETREELFGNKSLPKNIFIEKITTYLNQDIPNNKEIAHLFKIIHPGPFTIQTSEADEIIWIDWKIFLRDLKNNPNMYSQYSINAVNIYLKNIYK